MSSVKSGVQPSGESATSATSGASPRRRLEWLDFYRGLAVMVMVEAHVVNTFLHAAWSEPWRVNLNYLNGLVAPSFLFIAGYVHGLGLERRRTEPAPVAPRLGRLAGIAALGYGMHLPIGQVLHGQWTEAWRLGTQMDVLVSLAFSLMALVVIERLFGRMVNYAVSVAVVAVLTAAPWLVAWGGGPLPLVAAANQTTGSLFPLLPWAAFVFCGFGEGQRSGSWIRAFFPIVACSAAVVILGRADLSNVSAAFFFERLAWVLLLVPVCQWLSARCSPRVILFAGQESLVVYLSHLALIEIIAAGIGRNHFSLAATAALYPAVLGASYAVAFGWRRLSVWRADRAHRAVHPPGNSGRAA